MVNIRIEQACFFEPRSHEDEGFEII